MFQLIVIASTTTAALVAMVRYVIVLAVYATEWIHVLVDLMRRRCAHARRRPHAAVELGLTVLRVPVGPLLWRWLLLLLLHLRLIEAGRVVHGLLHLMLLLLLL